MTAHFAVNNNTHWTAADTRLTDCRQGVARFWTRQTKESAQLKLHAKQFKNEKKRGKKTGTKLTASVLKLDQNTQKIKRKISSFSTLVCSDPRNARHKGVTGHNMQIMPLDPCPPSHWVKSTVEP